MNQVPGSPVANLTVEDALGISRMVRREQISVSMQCPRVIGSSDFSVSWCHRSFASSSAALSQTLAATI
jgi:hypothetical protein